MFAETALVAHLTPVARQATKRLQPARRKVSAKTGVCDRQEYADTALSSAFEAFVQLGGDPEHPDAFPWAEQEPALLDTTIRLLRDYLRNGTGYADQQLRARPRTATPQTRVVWDSWKQPCRPSDLGADQEVRPSCGGTFSQLESERTTRPIGRSAGTFEDTAREQDRAIDELALQDLAKELAQILTQEELTLVVRHHFEDVSLAQIAEEAIAQGEASPKDRIESRLGVRMYRVRAKLRARLSARWLRAVREGF